MEIDGYRLGRKIAETELCSVHNAIDLTSSKTVSVRLFHDRLTRHPGFCEGFSRFAKSILGRQTGIMVTLRHFSSEPQHCHAITDFFPCLPLLQTQPAQVPAQSALQGGLEIAATLDLLHPQGLVHGALRPGNLFFNDHFRLTLGLGINRPEGPEARPLPIESAEAALYLPPEGGDGPPADWYALGVCLYQLLCGQPPFDIHHLKRQLDQKRRGVDALPASLDERLLPLLQALLHPDPQQRLKGADRFYQLAGEPGHRLQQPHFAPPDQETPQPADAPPSGADRPITQVPRKPADRTPSPAPSPASRRILVFSAAALLLGGIALSLLWPDTASSPPAPRIAAEPATTSAASASARQPQPGAQPPGDSPATHPAAPPPAAPAQNAARSAAKPAIPEDERQRNLARRLLAEGKPGKALQAIEIALRIRPDDPETMRLRQAIRDEIERRALLQLAQRQLEAGRIDRPARDNALESYRKLARLLPPDDPRWRQARSRLTARIDELARQAIARQQMDEALRPAAAAADLFPDYPPLQTLRKRIASRIENLRQARQKQRIASREQQQQRRERQARTRQRRQMEEQRQQLLQRFDRSLTAQIPPEDRLRQATAIFDQLRALNAPAAILQPLRQRLVDSRVRLSQQKLASGDLDAARLVLQQGLDLGDDSGALRRQMNRLQQAIDARQQQQHADSLIAEARLLIEARDASPDDLNRAGQLIHQVARLAEQDPRLPSLRQRLAQRYDQQAADALSAGQLSLAEQLLNQGLTVAPENPSLLARRQRLEQAKKKQERRAAPPPIIGTF